MNNHLLQKPRDGWRSIHPARCTSSSCACWLFHDDWRWILTPAISEAVVLVAVAILVVLFSVQRYGVDKVGWPFAPVVLLWFLLIRDIGIFNIWKYDSSVLKAFSLVHVDRFFRKGNTWPSLGGIILCITGTEAHFADLSQLTVMSRQIAFTTAVFPCLLFSIHWASWHIF